MTATAAAALDRVIADLPVRYSGPGGAVAVVRDGEPIVRHAWGFANLETRQPYTPATLAPICSITKHFTCATLLSAAPDPSELDPLVRAQAPDLQGPAPTTLDLANNQSGIRDYWALTVLLGAMPEGEFRPEDSARLIASTRSLHFAPGTRYSYSNGNFRMLALAVEQRTGRTFGDLMLERIVRPAGMETASFDTETGQLPGGATGYEGTLLSGWRPGINRIYWKGDAGITASLDDMIAWERFIDRTRGDAVGIYNRLSRQPTFSDGRPASYGLGLAHLRLGDLAITGHGGAIRGWRLQRLWCPSERTSVFIAFNHESDVHGAALHVLAAALGVGDPNEARGEGDISGLAGNWLDGETGLLLRVTANPDGTLAANYGGFGEVLRARGNGIAKGRNNSLSLQDGGVRLVRAADGIDTVCRAVPAGGDSDPVGTYHCGELDSTFEIINSGGSYFGGFRGPLGAGPLMQVSHVGGDLWILGCHRSLDSAAPGDWTIELHRSGGGPVTGLTLGCWLARKVDYALT